MRVIAALLAAIGLGAAVWFLRDATMSTHTVRHPDSQLAVTVDADVHRTEPGQSLEEHLRAKILFCRTQVGYSDPVDPPERVDGDEGTFRVVLQPSLDDTDMRQFRGCMEDWNMDQLQVDVTDMRDIPAPDGSG